MIRPTDLDPSEASEAAELLGVQRDAYAALLSELHAEEARPGVEPDRVRDLAVTVSRILHPLAGHTMALSDLARRLRQTGRTGPRAEATRDLLTEIGGHASEAKAALGRLVGGLRADQTRTLAELRELERSTPAAYHQGLERGAVLVDRTG